MKTIEVSDEQYAAYNRGEKVVVVKEKSRYPTVEDNDIWFIGYPLAKPYSRRFRDEIWDKWMWDNFLTFSTREELEKEMKYIEAVSHIRRYISKNFGEWCSTDAEDRYFPQYINEDIWEASNALKSPHCQPFRFLRTREQCYELICDCLPQLNVIRDKWN